MENSILTTIKKMIGLFEDNEEFDMDIIVLINSAINVLTQLGVGPSSGFAVTSKDQTWSMFVGDDPRLEMVKTYIYLKVETVFNKSLSSSLLQSYKELAKEYEWRLNVQVDPDTNFKE